MERSKTHIPDNPFSVNCISPVLDETVLPSAITKTFPFARTPFKILLFSLQNTGERDGKTGVFFIPNLSRILYPVSSAPREGEEGDPVAKITYFAKIVSLSEDILKTSFSLFIDMI